MPRIDQVASAAGAVVRHHLRRFVAGLIPGRPVFASARGKDPARRGRTAVQWAIAGFILLQLAYYPAADIWPMMRDVEYGEKLSNLRAQLAAKPKDKPSFVMFGSSLTGGGFNPSELETFKAGEPGQAVAFNFGINSGGAVVQLLCIRRMLADGIKPSLILLETHPQFLFKEFNIVPGEHFLQVWRFQKQDLEVMRRYDPKYAEFRREWKLLQQLPWYAQRHELQTYLVPHWRRRNEQYEPLWTWNDRNGWGHCPAAIVRAQQYTHEQIVQSIQHRILGLNRSRMEERFKLVYREIVETCQRGGVPVVLIRMPETTYARNYYSASLKKEIDEFYAQFTADMKVQLIDAGDWVADSEFHDGFHVDEHGAAVFTKRLERELLSSFVNDPSTMSAAR